MEDLAIVAGMVTILITGFLAYAKGCSDGLDKKDKEIENMIVRAIKKSKEEIE